MKKRRLRNRKFLGGFLLVVLLAAAVVGWMERTSLLAWYYVHGLTGSSEQEREVWIERTVSLDQAALPQLVQCLHQDDERACANAAAALHRLVERWGPQDPRTRQLAMELAEEYVHLSLPGQEKVLELHAFLLQGTRTAATPSPEIVQASSRMLVLASPATHSAVRAQALHLASLVMQTESGAETVAVAKELAGAGLKDSEAAVREHAIQLVSSLDAYWARVNAGSRQGILPLLGEVVRLLGDPAPAVRREALLAVGNVPEVITTDELVRWLHDPDAEVRRCCEQALRQRGVKGTELTLARLISDEKPSSRLQVIMALPDAEVEPSAWLRRLTLDPNPAVRAAALRMAAEPAMEVDLTDRMEQMTTNDPSPTIRQLAQYYLSQRKSRLHAPWNTVPSVN